MDNMKTKSITLVIIVLMLTGFKPAPSKIKDNFIVHYNGIYQTKDKIPGQGAYHYIRFFPDSTIHDVNYIPSAKNFKDIYERLGSEGKCRKTKIAKEGGNIYWVFRNKNDVAEAMYSGKIKNNTIEFYVMIRDKNDNFVYEGENIIEDFTRKYTFIPIN